jgi:hypothetical protein
MPVDAFSGLEALRNTAPWRKRVQSHRRARHAGARIEKAPCEGAARAEALAPTPLPRGPAPLDG